MRIACAKEIKKHEYRVGLTPACVQAYVAKGHQVTIESGAGAGAGYSDDDYRAAGAEIETDLQRLYDGAEMMVKVKEPQPEEFELFHKGQILYTYLHLAADAGLTQALLDRGIIGIAYETIQMADGSLPCLQPMSEIAGRLSVQEGAKYLEKAFGGRGLLLGGVPGVRRGNVVIIGGGVVGLNAAKIAVGIGAQVTILDISQSRLAYLDDIFGARLQTLFSNPANIEACLRECDVVIGAVLLPGARAPRLIRREHLPMMKPGAVIVDVAIDQGGCVETSHPTTHDAPIYKVDEVVHYCVANMPGSVPFTSTLALTNQTLYFGLQLAEHGLNDALRQFPALQKGVNLYQGEVVNQTVAQALNLPFRPLHSVLG